MTEEALGSLISGFLNRRYGKHGNRNMGNRTIDDPRSGHGTKKSTRPSGDIFMIV